MIPLCKHGFPLSLLLVVVAPLPAPAQATPTCAEAQSRLSSNTLSNRITETYDLLRRCPDEAARLFVSSWASPPQDSVALNTLAAFSGALRDQRVFDAARGVVLNAGMAGDARLAALQVLTMHYNECLSVMFRVDPAMPPASRVRAWLGQIDHNVAYRGNAPLGASVRTDVLSTLDAAAGMDNDSLVQQAARSLATALRRRDVSNLRCDGSFIRTP